MRQAGASFESHGWGSWRGWSGKRTWNWNSGWEEAAWSSAGWHEGFSQDDGGENVLKDQGHDVGVRWRSSSAESQGERGAGEACAAPEELARGDAHAQPDAQDDTEDFRFLHDAALRLFFLGDTEPGSDDDKATPGARTQMLVDDASDIDDDIAEYDNATGVVTCKLCNIGLNSKSQWADHQKGKKHAKKERAEERKRDDTAQYTFQ